MLKGRFLHNVFFKQNMQANIRYANYVKSPTCRKSVPRKHDAQKDQCVKISRDFPKGSRFLLKNRNSFRGQSLQHRAVLIFLAMDWCQIHTLLFLKKNVTNKALWILMSMSMSIHSWIRCKWLHRSSSYITLQKESLCSCTEIKSSFYSWTLCLTS